MAPGTTRPLPDCASIHTELIKPGVSLQLLHLEYLEQHPQGYRYTQFCEYYRRWLAHHSLIMRQVHRVGEKLFVDYSGQKPSIVDPATGEVFPVELFVAVLGASNYTYAEATRTQRVPDWIASHTRAFAFFGGVPEAIVCDQLKSGVVLPCRYEPGLQRVDGALECLEARGVEPMGPQVGGLRVTAHPVDDLGVGVRSLACNRRRSPGRKRRSVRGRMGASAAAT